MAEEVEVPADAQGDQLGDPTPAETPAVAPAAPATATADDPFDRPFVDPSTLPDEIKSHWKAMHRAHTKKLEEIKSHKADLEMLSRFRSDPAFARELLQFEAQRLGVNLAPSTATPPAAAPATNSGDVPARLVEAVRNRLDPSLHWMAESLAAAGLAATQEATRPLIEKDRAKELATREAEWGAITGKLTETAPGWEAHEQDMQELLDWLQKGPNTHPRFGSRLEFLYNNVTNGAAAKAAAIRAMGDAARNATRTGQSSRATLPNIADRVRKATTRQEALQIAAEEAEREIRAGGGAVPA